MPHGDFKDSAGRRASNRKLRDKAFNIAENSKYNGYQRGLASIVCKYVNIKTYASSIKNEIVSNQELTETLYKPIIEKFDKGKVHSPFIDNIWGADLADMQLMRTFNKGIGFLLCVIDIFSKNAWVILLKMKKELKIQMIFRKF